MVLKIECEHICANHLGEDKVRETVKMPQGQKGKMTLKKDWKCL